MAWKSKEDELAWFRANRAAWVVAHPDLRVLHSLRAAVRRRGFRDLTEYQALLDEQGGGCANPHCSSTEPGRGNTRWPADHSHRCEHAHGRDQSCVDCIRGLLCHGCNTIVGLAGDDPAVLRGLAEYLELDRRPLRDLREGVRQMHIPSDDERGALEAALPGLDLDAAPCRA